MPGAFYTSASTSSTVNRAGEFSNCLGSICSPLAVNCGVLSNYWLLIFAYSSKSTSFTCSSEDTMFTLAFVLFLDDTFSIFKTLSFFIIFGSLRGFYQSRGFILLVTVSTSFSYLPFFSAFLPTFSSNDFRFGTVIILLPTLCGLFDELPYRFEYIWFGVFSIWI